MADAAVESSSPPALTDALSPLEEELKVQTVTKQLEQAQEALKALEGELAKVALPDVGLLQHLQRLPPAAMKVLQIAVAVLDGQSNLASADAVHARLHKAVAFTGEISQFNYERLNPAMVTFISKRMAEIDAEDVARCSTTATALLQWLRLLPQWVSAAAAQRAAEAAVQQAEEALLRAQGIGAEPEPEPPAASEPEPPVVTAEMRRTTSGAPPAAAAAAPRGTAPTATRTVAGTAATPASAAARRR